MRDARDRPFRPPTAVKEPEETHYWRIDNWFSDLNPAIRAKLKLYHSELLTFNGRMSLISPRTEKAADLIHIADGILGSRIVGARLKVKEIFDLGSGNGVPGIVFATMFPDRMVRLVEADGRKIEFLKHCIGKLELKNCSTVHARLEDLKEGVIKAAMTRGLATISKALLLTRRCAANGCDFFHFKGQSWSKEVAEIPSQVLASWDPLHGGDYTLPEDGPVMTIVITARK